MVVVGVVVVVVVVVVLRVLGSGALGLKPILLRNVFN